MYLDGYRSDIVRWVAEGLSDRAIAERVRVSPSTVRYWRERNGVMRPKKKRPPTSDIPPTSDLRPLTSDL
jgi:transposase